MTSKLPDMYDGEDNAYQYHLQPATKHGIMALIVMFASFLVTLDATAAQADGEAISHHPISHPPKPLPPKSRLDAAALEQELQGLVAAQGLMPIDTSSLSLPSIESGKAQLGKKLFFTKNLGGEQSAACVSCHHPSLGGGDDLSLSVGVSAIDHLGNDAHDLLGQGRFNGEDVNNLPSVPRNAPTVFNLGLLTQGLFWDSRVERTPEGHIVTPDSAINGDGLRLPDTSLSPTATLASAQAKFPVTSVEEMRGSFAQDADNDELRAALTARFNNSQADFITDWVTEFERVYPETEITFDLIADAIAEYERSMVFIDTPWQNYLAGNSDALSPEQKAGAILFFAPPQAGGAGCMFCHNGPAFTDSRHHLVAFPQIGPGKGNESESSTSQDFGRQNITNNEADKYHFRTPSLLNIAATAPYGHTGSYQTLEQVVSHYNNPNAAINRLFGQNQGSRNNSNAAAGVLDGSAPFCQLPQIKSLIETTGQTCQQLYPDAYVNSRQVARHLNRANTGDVEASSPLFANANLSKQDVRHLVAFLNALTDPCVEDRACLAPWIVDQNDAADFPDDQPLIAIDNNDSAL